MDEEMMTRVYGKASYQKGRTTVKDPYLHFQNTAKQKPTRPVGSSPVKGNGIKLFWRNTCNKTRGGRLL